MRSCGISDQYQTLVGWRGIQSLRRAVLRLRHRPGLCGDLAGPDLRFVLQLRSDKADRKSFPPAFELAREDAAFQMIFLLGFGAFVLFVAGCVEAWYASGFGKMPQIDMWIAASVRGARMAALATVSNSFLGSMLLRSIVIRD